MHNRKIGVIKERPHPFDSESLNLLESGQLSPTMAELALVFIQWYLSCSKAGQVAFVKVVVCNSICCVWMDQNIGGL